MEAIESLGFLKKTVNLGVKVMVWVLQNRVVEFYDRERPAPSVKEYSKNAQEVWLSLFAGERAESDNLFVKGSKVKKILFPCPVHNSLAKLHGMVSGQDGKDFREGVIRRTKLAVANGIQVKWVDHMTPESMFITDPLQIGGESKILVDLYLPHLDSTGRPRIEVARYHKRLFSDLLESFNKTWDVAHDPITEDKE